MASSLTPQPPGQKPPQDLPRTPTPALDPGAVLDRAAKPLLDWLDSDKAVKWVISIVSTILSTAAAILLKLATPIAVGIAGAFIKSEERSQPEFDRLAETAIKDLLGEDIKISGAGQPGTGGQRKGTARDMGEAVLKGLFIGGRDAASAGLKPGDEGARRYMGMMLGLSLEGWLEGWLMEMLSLGQLEKFADLDDILAESLGLGRMSRRVMGPIADVLVIKPLEWDINKTYRPNLLSATEAARQFVRGRWTQEQMTEELARQGWSVDRIEALINAQARFVSIEELDCLVSHGEWTEAQAVQHLRDQGYPETTAHAIIRCRELQRTDSFRRAAVNVAADAFANRDIDEVQFRRVLDTSGLPQRERDGIRLVAGMKREFRSRDLSLSDIEQAVKRGILGLDDFRRAILKLGYSLDDARVLELLLLSEVRDVEAARKEQERMAAERQAEKEARLEEQRKKREQIEAELEVREISLAEAGALVRRGLRSLADYQAVLARERYSPEDQQALTELLADEIEERRAQEEAREEQRRQAAVRNVNLADVETAVKRGILDVGSYRAFLAGQGFAPEAVDLLVSLLESELREAAEAVRRREEAAAQLRVREISLADLEQGVRRGLVSMAQYRGFLAKEGFEADRIELLAALVQGEIDEDNAARKRREAAERAAAQRRLSLPDLEQAVRAGLRTVADYRLELARLGFSQADQDALERLLRLQLDADKADRRKREEAAARLAVKQISLGDVERAVKLGVVSMDVYRRLLAREGFPAEDQAILSGTLLAELAQVRQQQQQRQQAEAQLRRRGVSLADFERAVKAGARTIQEYQGLLAREGFTPEAIDVMTFLLNQELQQQRSAQELRQAVEQQLELRGLSLSQFERAVKAGIRDVGEYAAFLGAQNFSEEAVATLVALLVSELEEAAAKQPAG